MGRAVAAACACLGFIAAIQPAHGELGPRDGWRVYTRTHLEGYSPSVPVYGTFHDLEGDFERGEAAFTASMLEVGVTRGPWAIAAIARYDYHLDFDPDTAELAYRTENQLPVVPGRRYDVRLHANHARSAGLKVAYRFQPLATLDAMIAVSALRASQLTYGAARGAVALSSSGMVGGDASYDYTYTEDVLLGRRVDAPTGYGGAVDVALAWQASNRWRVALAVDDAYHYIEWDDAPFTRATLTSSVLTIDADGVLDTRPFLSGVEGERSFRQRLPARYRADVEFALSPRWTLTTAHLQVERINLTDLGARVRIGERSQLAFAWGAQSGALTLGWAGEADWGSVDLALQIDDVNHEAANYFGLRLGLQLALP